MQHHDPVYTIPEFPHLPEIPSITPTPSITVDIPTEPPVEPSLAELFLTMSNAMKQMAVKIHNLEVLLQPQAPTNIEEALMEFLTNSEFEDRVNELVEDHMRHNFDIDDHIDITDAVRDVINSSLTISFDI
jgi:hypothetical protein